MVRLFARFQVCFFILSWLTCLTVASLSVEERLQSLEAKVKQIDNVKAINDRIRKVLEDRTKRIESLEKGIQQLKSTVTELTKEQKTPKDDVGITTSFRAKDVIYRSCHEIRTKDSFLPSGMHWVDPDGQGIGDDPIQFYCNMTTGMTSVLHDSESPTNVGNCADPGCYSKSIKYSATKRQMTALIDSSNECHQSIKYNCIYAPFEINGVAVSWWNDINGNPQYFWAGSNSSVNTCQCGISGNCRDSFNKCNCDLSLPNPVSDSGTITNKTLLPITRLNFGRTMLKTSSGVYTLGRLECSGRKTENIMPSSCTDLRRIGHILNGFYSVMGSTMIESLYCDFTKFPSEAGFEKHLGYVDTKSLPTYFYVQKNERFMFENTPILFEVERVNIGEAMNLTSGIFTAPRPGLYFFTFVGSVYFISNGVDRCYIEIELVLNGKGVAETGISKRTSSPLEIYSISLQSILKLKAGDRVWLQIPDLVNANVNQRNLKGDNYATHFTGQLLQEDTSLSFS